MEPSEGWSQGKGGAKTGVLPRGNGASGQLELSEGVEPIGWESIEKN